MPLTSKLLLNHLDAWGIAFIIAALALINHDAINWRTTLLLLAITLGYWLAFVVNDYFDAPYDAQEGTKAQGNFFVRGGGLGRFRFVLLFLAAFIAYALLQFGWRGGLILLVSLFILWSYSAPPLRFKSRPGLDLLVHGLFVETFAYLASLFLLRVTWNRLDVITLLLAFLSSVAAQLEQQIRDYEIDRRTGRTFTTVLGRERTAVLLRAITLLIGLTIVVGVVSGIIPPYIWPLGLIALPTLLNRWHGRLRPFGLARLGLLSVLLAVGYTAVVYGWVWWR